MLAKAASTEHPEEAEAFYGKAQELMSRHSISEAMLGKFNKEEKVDSIEVVLQSGSPDTAAVVSFAIALAQVNSCAVMRGRGDFLIVYGYKDDLDLFSTIYYHVLFQAIPAFLHTEKPAGVNGRSWRYSFMYGYYRGIAKRIRAAHQTVIEDSPEYGLVLVRDRSEQVTDMARNNGWAGYSSTKARNLIGDGVTAGLAASANVGIGLGEIG